MNDKIIEALYNNPEYGLMNARKIYERLKDKGITYKQIHDFLSKQEINQVYKEVKKPSSYFPIIAYYENEIMQIDLADMSNISTTNNGYKYIMCGVDVFTRKAYCIPMKSKTITSVVSAFSEILKQAIPSIINCDNGSEFISKEFKQLAETNKIKINYVNVGDHHKLGIVDRFIRTLRTMINKYSTLYKTTKYIDVLPKLIKNYNSSYHAGIHGIPNQPDDKRLLKLNKMKYTMAKHEETKFNIDDNVRHVLNKKVFEKGSQPKWSKTVYNIVDKSEHAYVLNNGKQFKYYELQPVTSVQTINRVMTRAKEKEPTFEQMKKANTIKRRLRKEGVELDRILTTRLRTR